MKHFYLFVFFCISINSTFSQRICATYDYNQKQEVSTYASRLSSRNTTNNRDTVPGEQITVPVVIHILYNNTTQDISDAQVLSQLLVLNNDYGKSNSDIANIPAAFSNLAADVKIKFCLARTDPQGRSTNGIIRKYTREQVWLADDAMKFSRSGGDDAWDASRYLNIWVCNLFGRNLGYSSVPGSDPQKDGVVIQFDVFGTTGIVRKPFDKGRTATHEIGHWLGLLHLWGDSQCGDDHIDDTPPQKSYNNGCPSFPHTSNCSINANGDMFMNFMDFTDDACMHMFTTGQKNKMRSQFSIKGIRNSFLNSMACDSSLIVEAGSLPLDTVVKPSLISVYPNPSANYVILENKNSTEMVGKTLKIVNVMGRQVKTIELKSQRNIIAVNDLQPGIYFLKIEGHDKNITIKFLKL
jgi:hypothetical protein